MTKQLQYYERAVPVSAKRHRDWSLAARTDYEFAAHSNSAPMAAVEFPAAAGEYAIVFTGTKEVVQPLVILGLNPDENLYLDEQGKWSARYIPAFVRRYPFVFSQSKDDESKLILCIDEQYDGWAQDGSGRRLFDENGEKTAYFNKMFDFTKEYQREAERTRVFCRTLKELDLLEPMTAKFKLPSGQKAQLTGFMAIDRDKLKALPGDKLAQLAKTGELELMYTHLQSMRNLGPMLARFKGDDSVRESLDEEGDNTPENSPLH